MIRFDGKSFHKANRALPEERAVALSIQGSTHAVMMASPHDLEDFAYGFLLSDGVIAAANEIEAVEAVEAGLGIDLQIRLTRELAARYQQTRRSMVGPVGCGLCGVESLELAVPELKPVEPVLAEGEMPWRALLALEEAQTSRRQTGALHAAAILDANGELLVAREDIGRHNALDKAIGALMRNGKPTTGKIAVLSSRVSLDLVVKAVRARIGMVVARASPSDLALQYAQKWGLNLTAPVFHDEYFQSGDIK